MTDAASVPNRRRRFDNSALTRKRYRAERNFRLLGLASVLAAAAILLLLLGTIVANGIGAFRQHYVSLDVHFDAAVIDPAGNRVPAEMADANYNKLVVNILKARFTEVKTRGDRRKVKNIVTPNAPFILRDMVLANPDLVGTTQRMWFKMSDDMDMFAKGHIKRETKAADRQINDKEVGWFDSLSVEGAIQARFNTDFFTSGDSREQEEAGIMGAVVGSLLTMAVTLLLAFPIGVMAAVYLEEFAPRNRWTDMIEVNINNLAAVPSIVFGLLGLAMFLNFFGLPRSAPLVGGMALALMTLPTIIIAARSALKAVPPSIRQAALGMGASPLQTITHHVLPLAMPGILTGTIIGMAQALGETAPLLMIGMVAFIVDIPSVVTDPATVLPVQIFLWADSPERAFVEKTSAAIMVLLGFLILMNLLAVLLRRRFERRW